jgi:hypothetical protein
MHRGGQDVEGVVKKAKDALTLEFIRAILDYDPATGILRWRERPDYPRKWNSRHAGKPAGCLLRGYIQVRFAEHGVYPAHRLAWLLFTGAWPRDEIDHINGQGSDNRIKNLREADRSQNMWNKGKQSNNTTGYIGVRFRPHHGKWEARITKNHTLAWRGYFGSAQEAAAARRIALPQFHGEFAAHDRPSDEDRG